MEELRHEVRGIGRNKLERAVMTALMFFQSGYEVDEVCPVCGSVVGVKGFNVGRDVPSVWTTACDCGKCNSNFKGF
jgi:hypothetical protein